MATIKNRELSITLNFKDGSTQTLTGDVAQGIYQQYIQHYQGSINNALKYTNADGNEQFIEFECLCGLTNNGITETEVEVADCTSIDCLDCSNCSGNTGG